MGIPTQCMKSIKCSRAKPQYFANVSLKLASFPGVIYEPDLIFRINVKLGGINTIPDPSSVSVLTDPHNPTVVMGVCLFLKLRFNFDRFCLLSLGADVIHPAPGSDGRPSFTSLVGNVDSDTAKYVAGQFSDFSNEQNANAYSRFSCPNLSPRDDCRSLRNEQGRYTVLRWDVDNHLSSSMSWVSTCGTDNMLRKSRELQSIQSVLYSIAVCRMFRYTLRNLNRLLVQMAFQRGSLSKFLNKVLRRLSFLTRALCLPCNSQSSPF